MKRFLFRPFKWLGTKIDDDRRSYRRGLEEKLQSWRYAQTNDKEVYERDPELDAVKNAEQLAKNDPQAALLQLCALAERGSVWSMLLAGWAYQSGNGVEADQAQAERWYRRALEGGCQQAQLRLGYIYTARGDLDRCEEVYQIGAGEHWAPAMYYLARTKQSQPKTPERLEEVRILLEQAAGQGDVGAQLELAHFLVRGRYGLHRIPAGIRLGLDAVKKAAAFVDRDTPPRDGPKVAAL